MDRKAVSDHIKEILELTRNVAFACGIVVILGTVAYNPESIGVHQHATLIGCIVGIIGVGYVALSILQYELRYPVTSEKRWVRGLAWTMRFCLLLLLSEGAFIAVANHTDWAQAHSLREESTAEQDHHQAAHR
ncbi:MULTISPECIES: hypothetical protein [unclassified Luteibacter]|uniref:hypothetical protein n=1 Tax=Luteibacter sp. PvP019 TaxID=3156436 RepID=UPI0033912A6E